MESENNYVRIKTMNKYERIEYFYNKYGIKSNKFYSQIKDFVKWGIHRNLHGYEYTEDIFNYVYSELIIAFCGGKTTHYNKEIYKLPLYTTENKKKYKNIGRFILYIITSAVSKYKSKNFRKDELYIDKSKVIYDLLERKDFEFNNKLYYKLVAI